LIESGYKYYNEDRLIGDSKLSSAIYLLDADRDTPNRYLSVFKKLNEKLDYKTVDIPCDQLYQIDKLYKISRFGGENVCKTIDALAEVGYKLTSMKGRKWLTYSDVDVISRFSKLDVDNFLNAFRKLKEKFKYKSIGSDSVGQIDNLLAVSQVLGYSQAIDYLASFGYKLGGKNLITALDVSNIENASDKLLKDSLESFTPCLYKSHPVKFIEYFKGLSVEDKKFAIRSILNCDKASHDPVIIKWLDENYLELVREVGLGLV